MGRGRGFHMREEAVPIKILDLVGLPMRSGIMDCSEVVYEAIFEGKEKKGF
jgi:hypothetical protein